METSYSKLSSNIAIEDISDCFPKLNSSALLELYTLCAGLRDVVRIGVTRSNIAIYEKAISNLDLHCKVWKFELKHQQDRSIDSFRISSQIVGNGHGDSSILFVASNPIYLDNINAIGLEDNFLGHALGYPTCCIDSFSLRRKSFMSDYSNLYPTCISPFPYWSNVFSELFGYALFSHIPCSADCVATSKLAKSILNLLKLDAPFHYIELISELRSMILYSKELGVLSIKICNWDAEQVSLKTAKMTTGWRNFVASSKNLSILQAVDNSCDMVICKTEVKSVKARLFDFSADCEIPAYD